MEEQENRRGNWMDRNPFVRNLLARRDFLERAYYGHVDRYHQANEGYYRVYTWLAVSIVVLLVATSTILTVRPYYRHYQEQRGQKRAEEFMARKDYRNAALCAKQALRLNPSNVPACRVMVKLAELARSPGVLAWQQRIVDAEPTIENKLMLAASALRYQKPPFPLTSQILAELPASAVTNTTYQLIAASLAMGKNHLDEAESHFATANQLDPTNQLDALNLAIVRLGTTNETMRVEARATLVALTGDRRMAPAALRALVVDRLANHDLFAASNYSTRLMAIPPVRLADQLQNLKILQRLTNHAFASQLKTLEQETATNAAAVAEASAWMQANGLLAEDVQWLGTLTNFTSSNLAVAVAMGNGLLQSGDWKALREFASYGNWGGLEYYRFALVSHACDQLGLASLADVNWSAAENEAENSSDPLPKLKKLVELADQWQLNLELETLLQLMVQKYPKEHWAPTSLTKLYFSEGKTAAINELADSMAQRFPTDAVFKNNLAATALLLKTNLAESCQSAEVNYRADPGNPNVATTYAYALHLQGRDQEGLAVLEKFPTDCLRDPNLALYYGILLAAAGKHPEALPWLQIARSNRHLLPEERQLLAAALGE